MKKNFMKKALAVTLSAAMAFSLSSVNMMTASAAVHVVKTKKLTVGVKKKLKLKSNALGWKITKAKSSKTAVCKISKKAKGYVTLNPIKKGTAKITLTIKRKKPNKTVVTKKLKCTVTVQNAPANNPGPGNDDPGVDDPTVTSATATTQDELDAALNNADIKNLTISTNEEITFTIPNKTYDINLTVDAPNATVDNSGKFNTIAIKAISDHTWIEKAINNILNILSSKAHVRIEKGAKASVKVSAQKADVTLEVNGSADVSVDAADVKLDVAGQPEGSVGVQINAAGTEVTAKAPVAVTANTVTNVKLTFEKGSEGSNVAVKVPGKVELDVTNNSEATIAVTNNEGEAQTPVAVGATGKVSVTSKEDTTPGGTTPGGTTTNPGSSTTVDSLKVKISDNLSLKNTITADIIPDTVTVTGGAATVSPGSIKVTNIKTDEFNNYLVSTDDHAVVPSHCAVYYQVSVNYTNTEGDSVTYKSPTDFVNVEKGFTEINVNKVDISKKISVVVVYKVVQTDGAATDPKIVAESGNERSAEKIYVDGSWVIEE